MNDSDKENIGIQSDISPRSSTGDNESNDRVPFKDITHLYVEGVRRITNRIHVPVRRSKVNGPSARLFR
jgi:hypothetical protein